MHILNVHNVEFLSQDHMHRDGRREGWKPCNSNQVVLALAKCCILLDFRACESHLLRLLAVLLNLNKRMLLINNVNEHFSCYIGLWCE